MCEYYDTSIGHAEAIKTYIHLHGKVLLKKDDMSVHKYTLLNTTILLYPGCLN
jgi:hypothetical protein